MKYSVLMVTCLSPLVCAVRGLPVLSAKFQTYFHSLSLIVDSEGGGYGTNSGACLWEHQGDAIDPVPRIMFCIENEKYDSNESKHFVIAGDSCVEGDGKIGLGEK